MDTLRLKPGTLIKVNGIPFTLKNETDVAGNRENAKLVNYDKSFGDPFVLNSAQSATGNTNMNSTKKANRRDGKTLANVAALCAARLGDLTQPPNVRHTWEALSTAAKRAMSITQAYSRQLWCDLENAPQPKDCIAQQEMPQPRQAVLAEPLPK